MANFLFYGYNKRGRPGWPRRTLNITRGAYVSGNTSQGTGRGFWGRVLHVDLSAGRVEAEDFSEDVYQKRLSGVGLGAKVLWDRMRPGSDPLGPDNILGFTTGLLTGTKSLFTGRFTVVGKSPNSKGWGDANCGGFFSARLKGCGVDAVFFHGAGERPVYFYLDDNGAEIRDASDLWGLDTVETETRLKERYGKKAQIACIGPAGERLSFIAGICHDKGRYAARSGLGSVMGSKNLKAVVAAGTRKVEVADKARMAALSKDFRHRLNKLKILEPFLGDRLFGLLGWFTRKNPLFVRQPADLWRLMLGKFGTPSLTAMSAELGDSPIKNWGGVGYIDFPLKRSQKIGAQSILSRQVKKYGCHSCPLRCGGIMKVTDGPYPIEEMHKPEYETICAFGSLTLNNDLYSIFKVNDLVNRGGVDSISCGAVVAFAIECFENNILTKKDTGGLDLRWGNPEAVIRLTEMIINREGLGDILADGVKPAAERIGLGAEKYAVHCGGVEPGMHDPKIDPGFAASYFCEPTPGRHTIASYMFLDVQGLENKFSRAKKIPAFSTRRHRFRYDGTGEALVVDSFFKMLVDGAGVCLFGTQVGGGMPLCEWLNAATGWDLSNDEYLVIGERIEQLRHAFNIREGFNPIRDFRPHPRVYGDPPSSRGPAKGVTIDVDTMAQSFYQALHWDLATGKPKLEHLKRLGLTDVAETLYPSEFF